MSLPRFTIAAALAAAMLSLAVSPARAATHVLKPTRGAGAWLTFKSHGLRAGTVVAARLQAGSRRRALNVRSVRAAVRRGRVRVRAPRWARRPARSTRAAGASRATLVLTTTCGSAGARYGPLVLGTAGLRAYYRLDERSGRTACDLEAGLDGSYRGGVTLAQPGALAGDAGASVALSGAGFVRIPSAAALNPTRALSLEAWVRPSSVTPSQTVARKDGQYLLRVSDGRVSVRIWSSAGLIELVSPQALRAGVFQHVVATFDGSALSIYLDGRPIASRSASGRIRTTGNSLYLGASLASYDYLRGGVDEVAVYGAALTPDVVARHRDAAAEAPTTPAPTPIAEGVSDVRCGFGAFAPGRWPTACWRPYGADSPFNQPLPADPRLAPGSAQVVSRLLSFGAITHLVAGQADTADDYSHPTYYSQPTDPVFTLHCYESSWGRCSIEGLEIRVPDAARPAAGGDGHLTVVDQASGWEYDLYKVRSKPSGGGTLEFRWGGRTRIDGDGLESDATAARFGNLAGIIRADELAAGRIDHALFLVANCDAGRFVYPAAKSGRSCAALGQSTADAPPMGARLQLAMTPEQIAALPVPAWKRTILRAMATYGMIMGDTGGGSWGIQAESGSAYTSFGHPDPLVEFAQANDWTPYDGTYVANLRSDVDWARYLRVIDPCVSQRTC